MCQWTIADYLESRPGEWTTKKEIMAALGISKNIADVNLSRMSGKLWKNRIETAKKQIKTPQGTKTITIYRAKVKQ